MLYLKLHHGRHDPDQDMDGTGFDGPDIGPLQWIGGTYTCHLRIAFIDEANAAKFGIDPTFPVVEYHDDMIVHQMPGGVKSYYGDWTIHQQGEG